MQAPEAGCKGTVTGALPYLEFWTLLSLACCGLGTSWKLYEYSLADIIMVRIHCTCQGKGRQESLMAPRGSDPCSFQIFVGSGARRSYHITRQIAVPGNLKSESELRQLMQLAR